jgi:hypothetical protein
MSSRRSRVVGSPATRNPAATGCKPDPGRQLSRSAATSTRARGNSHVCRFGIAFMQAASGRRIQHTECIVRDGRVCRFLIGDDANNA